MPTKKSNKTQSSKKQASKSGRKKSSKKDHGGLIPFQGNPPILVGGGGSTLIWIKNIYNPREIRLNQVGPNAIRPANPGLYTIYQCDPDLTQATVNKGDGHPHPHQGMGRNHFTEFDL
jgi:hypothetical protein